MLNLRAYCVDVSCARADQRKLVNALFTPKCAEMADMKRDIVKSATHAALGKVSEPGNGDISRLSRQQCNAVVTYLAKHKALPPICAPIPMDVLRRITGRPQVQAAQDKLVVHAASTAVRKPYVSAAVADNAVICLDRHAPRLPFRAVAVRAETPKLDVLYVLEVLASHGIDRGLIDSIAADLYTGRKRGCAVAAKVAMDVGREDCKTQADDDNHAACEWQDESGDYMDGASTNDVHKKRKVHADVDDNEGYTSHM